jgi:actin-related protein
MIEGLADRFKKEIEKLAPSVAEINVIAPTERKNAVWRGASIYASQSDF